MRTLFHGTVWAWVLLALGPETAPAQELGTDANPIECDSPEGESRYLSRLRTPDGERIRWRRRGSNGANPKTGHAGHILDIYESDRGDTLYMDMYHPQVTEIHPPKGFRLVFEWSNRFEYVNGRLHRFGEARPYTGKIDEANGENGEERLVAVVKEGILAGKVSQLNAGGKVKWEIEYGSNNRPQGKKTWYHEDGSILARYTMREGVPHGPFEYRPKDGSDEMIGEYKDGEKKKADGSN